MAVAGAEASSEEIDLSSEWDDSLTVETDSLPPAFEVEPPQSQEPAPSFEIASSSLESGFATAAAPRKPIDPEKAAEAIEEIRFYLEHGMPEQATAAFQELQHFDIEQATIDALRAEIEGGAASAPAEQLPAVEAVSAFSVDPSAEEETSDEISAPAQEIATPQSAAAQNPPAQAPAPEFDLSPSTPEPVMAPVTARIEPSAVASALANRAAAEAKKPEPIKIEPAKLEPVKLESTKLEPAKLEPAEIPPPAPQPAALQEVVSDLEASLTEASLYTPPAVEAASASAPPAVDPAINPELEPVGQAAPTVFGVSQNQMMGEFVADIEASLGEDFLKDAPLPSSDIPPAIKPTPALAPNLTAPAPVSVSAPVSSPQAPPAPASAPLAASAAAASGGGSATLSHPAPVQSSVQPVAAPLPVTAVIPSLSVKSSPFGEDPGIDLSQMFGELKDDLESGSDEKSEDPETHYNLGIAFREMGLLDEAIGELQKTCHAVDHGHPFPNIMQTYTWLAQCFIDKGVPEAAIRWYDKALRSPGIDEDTRTALHYEIASAHESAGDRPSAVKHFMEVYGRNIDYRDVAERIKALKS
jgi:tetratricopeptide (TPR) repeat protein